MSGSVGVRVVARAVAEEAVRAQVVQVDVELPGAAVRRVLVRERRAVPDRVDLLEPDLPPGDERQLDPVRDPVGRVDVQRRRRVRAAGVVDPVDADVFPAQGARGRLRQRPAVADGTSPTPGRARIRSAVACSEPPRSSTRAARSRRMSVASFAEGRATSPNSRRTRVSWKTLRARSSVYSASVSSPVSSAALRSSSATGTGGGSGRSSSWAQAGPASASRRRPRQAVRPRPRTGDLGGRICSIRLYFSHRHSRRRP